MFRNKCLFASVEFYIGHLPQKVFNFFFLFRFIYILQQQQKKDVFWTLLTHSMFSYNICPFDILWNVYFYKAIRQPQNWSLETNIIVLLTAIWENFEWMDMKWYYEMQKKNKRKEIYFFFSSVCTFVENSNDKLYELINVLRLQTVRVHTEKYVRNKKFPASLLLYRYKNKSLRCRHHIFLHCVVRFDIISWHSQTLTHLFNLCLYNLLRRVNCCCLTMIFYFFFIFLFKKHASNNVSRTYTR